VATVDAPGREDVRLAELMAAWSLAIDVAMASPLESGLRICLLATRLAEQLGAGPDELRRTYYLALLRHIGCTAASQEFADIVGDERAFRESIGGIDVSSTRDLMPHMLRFAIGYRPPLQRPAAFVRLLTSTGTMKEATAAVCEVAQLLARRLGLDPGLQTDLAMVYERYDGKGFPNRVPGDAIPLPPQVVQLAEAVTTYIAIGGREAADAMVRERSGHAFRPAVADCYLRDAEPLRAEPEHTLWDAVIDAEPGSAPTLTGDSLDEALRALADFVDLKSPYTVGHSSDVARLAADGAEACGMSESEIRRVRRAGWLHDVGRVSVSARVWGKAGALTRDEWEQVRLHAYYTERVLSRPAVLAAAGSLGALHHERVDGSGYHRAQPGSALPPAARILAAADVYAALVADRPHRAALPASDAARRLRDEVRAGALDATAVDAVLGAAGHRRGRKRVGVAGLTARELEVLTLMARGRANREIAAELVVSRRTVEHHVESIYDKAGVRTRAAATMFALQHGIVGSGET